MVEVLVILAGILLTGGALDAFVHGVREQNRRARQARSMTRRHTSR